MKIMDREVFAQQDAFGIGAPNVAYAQYFIGRSYLKPLTQPDASAVFLANVTFEPACRNNWHIHHATKGGGQLPICTRTPPGKASAIFCTSVLTCSFRK